jgi:hypothetical protein
MMSMRASVPSAVLGVALGVALVLAVSISDHPGWGFFSHTECQLDQNLGNLTVWAPAAVVAAPYHGTESGSVVIWSEYPWGLVSFTQQTILTNGSVRAYAIGYENWSISTTKSVTLAGPGPETPCTSSMVAFFANAPAQGLRSGGISWWQIATNLTSDSDVPVQLNSSALCASVENTSYAGCAVGAQFDVNFQTLTGTVDTCGETQDLVLPVKSVGWPITVPYQRGGRSYTVPLQTDWQNSANYTNGTEAWYNYTFPANGGIWQYDNLSQTSSTGAGLAFSYSPCP